MFTLFSTYIRDVPGLSVPFVVTLGTLMPNSKLGLTSYTFLLCIINMQKKRRKKDLLGLACSIKKGSVPLLLYMYTFPQNGDKRMKKIYVIK